MTAEELEKIVARHEMLCLELKESFNVECIETACAFTNAQGGFIVIGVDNYGNPSKHQLRFEGLRDYENKISTATEPSVAVDAQRSRGCGSQDCGESAQACCLQGAMFCPQGQREPSDDTCRDCGMPFEVHRQ